VPKECPEYTKHDSPKKDEWLKSYHDKTYIYSTTFNYWRRNYWCAVRSHSSYYSLHWLQPKTQPSAWTWLLPTQLISLIHTCTRCTPVS
jgi:hypothetical protein